MKKLVVIGLAMAMTAAMVNGVCAQPVQAADGEGLKVALLLSGAANDQGWNQTAYEGAQKACEKYGYWLTQRTWKLLIFPPLLLTMQVQVMMW